MMASNFPVDSLCATYDEIFSGLKTITQDLPPSLRHDLFYGTADRVYRPV